jgi:hydrogenase expression/formation protein HypC
MCLSIPAKVMSIENDKAIVSIGGTEYEASLQLLEDVKIGDYILLHTGFAISKLSEEEAQETFKLFKEIEDIGDKL